MMDKEFSEGFMQDIADLLEFCLENKTDGMELCFDIDGNTLKIDITFEIMKAGAEWKKYCLRQKD